ncbi:phosphatase PAP2 family protein, partial [Candidatus Berkelbacteria bacterium]|nr:phosphatase PAP2 family protein [Candidatus Berkelbacteria bacterium]
FFRARPSLAASQELLFHRPDKAFPSDHATFGFALAFSFWLAGYKKLAVAIFILTLVFSFGRVATGLHYASDVVGGFVVGVVVGYIFFLLRKPIDRYITDPLIKIAKMVRLA